MKCNQFTLRSKCKFMSNSEKQEKTKTLHAFLILLFLLLFRSHVGLLINANHQRVCWVWDTWNHSDLDIWPNQFISESELCKVRRKSLKAILRYLFTFFTRMAVCTYTRWTEDPKHTSSLWPWLSPASMHKLITISPGQIDDEWNCSSAKSSCKESSLVRSF